MTIGCSKVNMLLHLFCAALCLNVMSLMRLSSVSVDTTIIVIDDFIITTDDYTIATDDFIIATDDYRFYCGLTILGDHFDLIRKSGLMG